MESPVIMLTQAQYKGEDAVFYYGIRDFAIEAHTGVDLSNEALRLFYKAEGEEFPLGKFGHGHISNLDDESSAVLKAAGLENANYFVLGGLSVIFEEERLYDLRDHYDKAKAEFTARLSKEEK